MNMNGAGFSGPGVGCEYQCQRDRRDPLCRHQPRKQTIGAPIDLLLLIAKEHPRALRRSGCNGFAVWSAERGQCRHDVPFLSLPTSEQPNTDVDLPLAARLFISATIV